MRNEKKVIDDFNRYFNKIKNETIVLYGVGKYTKLILENLSDYSVVGLMDEKQVGNTIYGKKYCQKMKFCIVDVIILLL